MDQRAALFALWGEAQADGVAFSALKDVSAGDHYTWPFIEKWAKSGDVKEGPAEPRTFRWYAQRALDIRAGK